MEILEFKEKMSLKTKILIAIGIILILLIGSAIAIYILNDDVKEWVSINIFRRDITEGDTPTIVLDVDKTNYVYAYDRYISVLTDGEMTVYNNYASKETEFDIGISNPIYDTNNNYIVVAENNGDKITLISDTRVLWENKVEGDISKVNVSKSGIVSVVTSGTSYKSVVIVFDRNGEELFKTFLASTIAVDTDISVDGKLLAIGEVNTGGSLIESSIKIIDVEKAKEGDSTNSVIFKHNANSNQVLLDVKYQEKGQLVCMYDDSIHIIENDADTVLVQYDSETKVADINLKSYVIRGVEMTSNLISAKTNIILKNIISGVEITYSIDSSIKEIVSYNQISAINLGNEIHFINLNGWLERKYISSQESKEIVLGNYVAGIVYRDRIKVITL